MTPVNLEERLKSIETRLTTIENKLNIPAERVEQWVEPPLHPSLMESHEPSTLSIFLSKPANWLGLVAVICFVLAAGFMIKLAINTGWLTPIRQICLVALFGLTLIGAGLALLKSNREYASFLPAAGIVILYLTIFAAHQLYFLVTFKTAVVLTGLVSGFCIWLYIKIKHEIYSFVAVIGAYLMPVFFQLNVIASFSLYYFLCCSLAFSGISLVVKSRTLTIIGAYLAILVTSLIGLDLNNNVLTAIFLALHFLIFSVATFLYLYRTRQQLTTLEAWCFFPALIMFYTAEYYFIDSIRPNLAPWISLVFAGFLSLLYFFARRSFHSQKFSSQSMLLTFITVIFFHSVYLELLPASARHWLFVVMMLGLATFPLHKLNKQNRSTWLIPAAAIFVILEIEYVSMVWRLITQDNIISWIIMVEASFFSMWVFFIRQRNQLFNNEELCYVILGMTHLLGISGLYQLTTAYGSLAVSISWLLYAVCVISFAFLRKDEIMAKSALLILSLAAGKALLYDAASAPTLVRILCLMFTGLVLYIFGFIFKKISAWKN